MEKGPAFPYLEKEKELARLQSNINITNRAYLDLFVHYAVGLGF